MLPCVACCTVNRSKGRISLCEAVIALIISWVTATLLHPLADKRGLLQPGLGVCVLGGTAVQGAGQQLRMRGAYVETAVVTPLPHMTQLPAKTTHWAFPSPLIHFPLLSHLCQQVWHILLIHVSFYVKNPVCQKQEPSFWGSLNSGLKDGLDTVFPCMFHNINIIPGEACLSIIKNQADIKTNSQALVWKNQIM